MSIFLSVLSGLFGIAFLVSMVRPTLLSPTFTRKQGLGFFGLWLVLSLVNWIITPTKSFNPPQALSQTTSTTALTGTPTGETDLKIKYKEYLDPQINKQIFDVPSLLGKDVDQIRQVLGKPVDKDIEPTELQLEMMGDNVEWDNSFEKEEVTLLVTYDARTRNVKDFFIGHSVVEDDKETLYKIGNVKQYVKSYRLEFVKANLRPGLYTGLKITPTR